MKFLDANVFVYAYYKPRRRLTEKERRMKNEAKRVIKGISDGEVEVLTTVVHMSEAVNILKHGMPLEHLIKVILGLFMFENVKVLGVDRDTYFAAAALGGDLKLDPNDALAVEVMRLGGVDEIYSFDEDFEKIEKVTRLPKI
ncbi:MAG: type II toxin-antitoxin system VapC family toxin [Thermoproteota archaeon]|nr:type II toxin-antitoxin system VapC family toxin [Thermoproteota archaeon]